MKNNTLVIVVGVVIVGIIFVIINFWSSANNKNYRNSGMNGERTLFINSHQNDLDSKACQKNSDCELTKCGGCFNREYLKNAPPELPCSKFEGYRCSCQYNQCTENK